MKIWSKFVVGAALVSASGVACANETVSYTYDALGRLTAVATSGGPNSGTSVATGFDPAGNRTSYSVSGSSQAMQSMDTRTLTAEPAAAQATDEGKRQRD